MRYLAIAALVLATVAFAWLVNPGEPGPTVTEAQARAVAQEAVPDGTITEVEAEDGTYEVEFALRGQPERTVVVDGRTGNVLSNTVDD